MNAHAIDCDMGEDCSCTSDDLRTEVVRLRAIIADHKKLVAQICHAIVDGKIKIGRDS